MTITVYSKPACSGCIATKRKLDKHGLEYELVDMSQDADAVAAVKALGYQQAPVVVAGDQHWGGYQPDKIEELLLEQAA